MAIKVLPAHVAADPGSLISRTRPDGLKAYVQPIPGPGGKKQITNGGGTSTQWGRDGRQLFYVASDNRLMAVPIALNGTAVEAGKPVAVFTLPPGSRFAVFVNAGPEYAPSRDGPEVPRQ